MKKLALTMAIFLTFAVVSNVLAFDWSGTPINSGYAVTTDKHGMEVPLGTPVTAWAGTTDLSITEVKFRWLYPNGSEFDIVSVYWDDPDHTSVDEWEGQPVRQFNNTIIPNVVGDWGVQAIFYNSTGGPGRGPVPTQPYKVAIRARSFFAIPEVAIGTIAILISMFGALGFFAVRKKRITLTRKSL